MSDTDTSRRSLLLGLSALPAIGLASQALAADAGTMSTTADAVIGK